MRKLLVGVFGALPFVVLGACTGDDPIPVQTAPEADGSASNPNQPNNPFDATSPTDGGGGTDAPTDSGPTRPCDLSADFGVPEVLKNLNTGNIEASGTLTEDEKTIIFVSNQKALYSTRTSHEADFDMPGILNNVNGEESWRSAFVTHDKQVLYLTSSNSTVYASELSLGEFPKPVKVSASQGTTPIDMSGTHVFLNYDKNLAYFDFPGIPAGGGSPKDALFTNGLIMPTAWNEAKPIAEFPADKGDNSPVVTKDELTMYFASRRASTNEEIYVTHRKDKATQWGTPALVKSVNSTEDDRPTWISHDLCRLYISSKAKGNFDLYVAKRPR